MRSAIEAGVMFGEPRVEDHDGWVAAARAAAGPLSPAEVGEAFLASLSSGRLDLRSALGSFAVARYLPEHRFSGPGWCQVCHIYVERDGTGDSQDLNVLNFERFKWAACATTASTTWPSTSSSSPGLRN
jgi:hypothetical protein